MKRFSKKTIQFVVAALMVGFPVFGMAIEKNADFCFSSLLADIDANNKTENPFLLPPLRKQIVLKNVPSPSNPLGLRNPDEAMILELLTHLPDSMGLVPLIRSQSDTLNLSQGQMDGQTAAPANLSNALVELYEKRQNQVLAMVNLAVVDGLDGTHIQFLSRKKYFEKFGYPQEFSLIGRDSIDNQASQANSSLNSTYVNMKKDGSLAQLEFQLLGLKANQVDRENFEIVLPTRYGGLDLSGNLEGTPFSHVRGLLRVGSPTTPVLLYIFALAYRLIPLAEQVLGLGGLAHDLVAHALGFFRMPKSLWNWAQVVSQNLLKQYFSARNPSDRAIVFRKMSRLVDAFDGLSARVREDSHEPKFQEDPLVYLQEHWAGVWESGIKSWPIILTPEEFLTTELSELEELALGVDSCRPANHFSRVATTQKPMILPNGKVNCDQIRERMRETYMELESTHDFLRNKLIENALRR